MSMQAAGFVLAHLRYGSLVNPTSADWGVGNSSLTMASAMSSSLFSKAVLFHHKANFAISSTVSIAVQNMGGKFFYPIGRVRGIATNSSSSPSEGKTSPILGASVGRKKIR